MKTSPIIQARIEKAADIYFQFIKMGIKQDLAIYGAAKKAMVSEKELREEIGAE